MALGYMVSWNFYTDYFFQKIIGRLICNQLLVDVSYPDCTDEVNFKVVIAFQ